MIVNRVIAPKLPMLKKLFLIIDRVIAQKLPMLKQGTKRINTEFIRTRALS